jgi:Fe(3+) dicitrate transport protein
VITRWGSTYTYRRFSITFQGSDVAAVYTDAGNTETPNAAGTLGRLEGYRVMDLSITCMAPAGLELRAGVNNIGDAIYATRRAGGYPGPGILPANGRTLWLSIGAKF